MKIGTVVALNNVEQYVCKHFINNVLKNNELILKKSKVSNQSHATISLEGFGAEWAYCKMVNIYPDLTIKQFIKNGEDDTGDCTFQGKRIDVKSTNYTHGKLIVPGHKKCTVYAFALMIGRFPTYTFKGYALAKELLTESRKGDLGYGQSYIMSQPELVEFEDLKYE